MKKFIIAVAVLVVAYLAWDYAYYTLGVYVFPSPQAGDPLVWATTDSDTIYVDSGGGPEPFVVQGVNLGVGLPGEWATDYAIDKETYLRWFRQIQDMGANTIRVYTILHDDFYEAFYQYNKDNPDPLYLLHGVWVNDYVQNSHRDAYDDEFLGAFLADCRTLVDLLHGNKKLSLGRGTGSGSYRRDVSPWVLGYILGVEWEDVTVAYTDQKYPQRNVYEGAYFSAAPGSTPFEAMLAQVADKTVEYETNRYGQQRLIAFSNWPTTDPFEYPATIATSFDKCAQVDTEHILPSAKFKSGRFASYHVYPYYPDYANLLLELDTRRQKGLTIYHARAQALLKRPGALSREQRIWAEWAERIAGDYKDPSGRYNTYYTYLRVLTSHHTMPVVISEFGVSTGRGMAQRDFNTRRNQGHMSETQQGEALARCWRDILDAGCAGGCVFTWQDEWFKRTWNTMHAVDLNNTPYWSDYQTNEQYFGLLSFDPGKEQSVCYVNGDLSEWGPEDVVWAEEGAALSMKYDERFLYFLIYRQGFGKGGQTLYLPIDTTPKSGSNYCENHNLKFERDADFLVVIDGKEDSRVLVQERYEVVRAMYGDVIYGLDPYIDPPEKYSPRFTGIDLPLTLQSSLPALENMNINGETYETGLLRYGNADPASPDFDSLADFIFAGDSIELKLPWQLLNFSNPSEMQIHDDYYEHYGVENLSIDKLYVGLGTGETRIPMAPYTLKGWGKTVTWHERLKPSYYAMQALWRQAG